MKEKRTEKKCISCGEVKDANTGNFFYRNKSKGWFSSWCKICHKNKRKSNAEKNNKLQRKRRQSKVRVCHCGNAELGKGRQKCDECIAETKRKHHRLDKPVVKKRLKDAMPIWADKEAIKMFYARRPEGFHVDHIIPIRGRKVCGLHVIDNMQYLTEADNMRKGNHFSFEYQGFK